jgi:hypothetical protein
MDGEEIDDMTAINKLAGRPDFDGRKRVLIWAAVAIVASGLFPPWLYVFDKSGPNDRVCGHWEVSAGFACIFSPPSADYMRASEHDALSEYYEIYFKAPAGLKLDLSRLLVEWACILAVTGAGWGLAQLNRKQPSQSNAG